MNKPDAHSTLTPAQRYVADISRATVQAYQAYGTEAVARWNAAPPGTVSVSGAVDLPGGLVFAYDIAMRQIGQLLAIIDTLTGAS